MIKTAGDTVLCASEACGRPAALGEIYCEECALERMLYRRDLREGAESGPDRWPGELGVRPRQPEEGPGPF
jgi:hypothetical protein